MAGYTVQNLKEVENQGVKFGMDESDLEFRSAKVPLDCEHCGVSYLKIGSGWRVPWGHTHKTQEEIYILVNGSARMKIDDELVEMQPFTAAPPGEGAVAGGGTRPPGGAGVGNRAPPTGGGAG